MKILILIVFIFVFNIKNVLSDSLYDALEVTYKNNKELNGSYEWATGYKRNQVLVDLINTPSELQKLILEQFEIDPGGRDGLFNYFVKSRLNNLIENISEF